MSLTSIGARDSTGTTHRFHVPLSEYPDIDGAREAVRAQIIADKPGVTVPAVMACLITEKSDAKH